MPRDGPSIAQDIARMIQALQGQEIVTRALTEHLASIADKEENDKNGSGDNGREENPEGEKQVCEVALVA